MSRPSPSPLPNRSNTQSSSHRNGIKGKSFERDNKNTSPEFPKVSSIIKCYKCQGYEHLAVNCPSLIGITIINETPTEATESDFDVYIFKEENSKTDEKPRIDDVGFNCIDQAPSGHLSVIRCVLSQPTEEDDWRKSATFHIFTKIGDKNCKVIVNSGSISMQYHLDCMNILD